ncbi:MAG: prephenate dehydrogenase [Candidatus Anammoxibacter sp.]
MKSIFDTCAIIGPGLIGGSIGLGLKSRGLVKKVIGVGHRQKSIREAIKKGAIDEGTTDVAAGVSDADLVIIATQVSLIPQKLREVVGLLKNGALLTDVGSTKRFILDEFKNSLPKPSAKNKLRFDFIGSHPIAGSENSGVGHATPKLFEGSICVLTPTKTDNKSCIKNLTNMWKALGSKVITMTAEQHDKILAKTSHLPQLMAFAMSNIIKDDQWKYSGGGLKDITRIASSDPGLWLDICNQNQTNIVDAIDTYIKELSLIRGELASKDNAKLLRRFGKAREKRDSFYKTAS